MSNEPIMHGGRLDEARRRFPLAREPWLDLSTGINPIAFPLPPLDPGCWARLPTEADLARLVTAAAEAYRVADPARIAAAPGTQALIQLLPRLRARSRVAIVGLTYQEHERCWGSAGHAVERAASVEDAVAGGADVVVVVNPDNPSGRYHSPATLRQAAGVLTHRNGLLVVDEAFIEALPKVAVERAQGLPSLVADLPPAVVVLRSFGKIYGLAGLRLGFAITDAGLAAALTDALGPWAVAGPAIEIGTVALSDRQWLAATQARLAGDVVRMDGLLGSAGFVDITGTLLFRTARVSQGTATGWYDRFGRAGILARIFPYDSGLIRFGVPGTGSEWDRLAACLSRPCPS